MRCSITTPTAGLALDGLGNIGKLEETGGARKQLSPEVGEQSKREHIESEFVHDLSQLLDLRWGLKLCFVAHEVIEWLSLVSSDVSKVDRRIDHHCLC